MKSLIFSLLTVFSLISSVVFANPQSSEVCSAELVFHKKPLAKNQTLALDKNISLKLHQYLTTYTHESAQIATNVTCQQLTGASYTGSDEEWGGVIKSALDGIQAKGATDVKLALTTELGKVYKGSENNKEYDFRANFTGNKQVIKNLTVLDLPRNTVYTLSVSGAEQIEDEVVKEFTRLVNSFKLKGAQ